MQHLTSMYVIDYSLLPIRSEIYRKLKQVEFDSELSCLEIDSEQTICFATTNDAFFVAREGSCKILIDMIVGSPFDCLCRRPMCSFINHGCIRIDRCDICSLRRQVEMAPQHVVVIALIIEMCASHAAGVASLG